MSKDTSGFANSKRFTTLLVCIAGVISIFAASCSQTGSANGVGEQLEGLAAGIYSGKCVDATGETLTVYSGRTENLVKPVIDAFQCETGIAVEVRWGSSVDLALLIDEEGEKSPADVFLIRSPGPVGFLEGRDRLKALPQSVLDLVPEKHRSKQGDWVGVTGRKRVAVYNLDNVEPSQLPASVFELTDPKWESRVALPATNGSFVDWFTVFRSIHGDEVAKTWLEDMVANGASYYPNNRSIVEAVGRGEVDLGLVNHYYNYQEAAANPESHRGQNHNFDDGDIGSLLIITAVSQLASSEKDVESQALISYMLSESAQQYFTNETFEYPLGEGVSPNQALADLRSLDIGSVDFDALGGDFDETTRMIEATGITSG